MRLMGVTDLRQLNEYYVNTSILEQELPKKVDLVRNTASKL